MEQPVISRSGGLKHGAYSEAQIAAKARSHRRRFLRRAGLRAADLDAVAYELLRHWARGQGQLDLFDASGERGSRNYWTAYNGVSRVLRQLELRIKATAGDDDDPVRRYVEAVHGNGGGA